LIQHIEQGNPINGYVFETLRATEKEVRDLRGYFSINEREGERMNKRLVLLLVVIGMFWTRLVWAAAPSTQVDSLIQILVDKHYLTENEAEQVKGQITYDEKTIREQSVKSDLRNGSRT